MRSHADPASGLHGHRAILKRALRATARNTRSIRPLYNRINEYFYHYIRDRYPEVLTEKQTVEQILEKRTSLARYGDAEFKLCRGKSVVRQPTSPAMSRRLRDILRNDAPNLAVGIPPFPDRARITDPTMDSFFRKFYFREWESVHYMKDKIYLSSFAFCPDHCNLPHEEVAAHIGRFRRIWQDREVTFVCNDQFRDAMSSSNLFDNTKSRSFVRAPDKNAYGCYDDLLEQSIRRPTDNLFLLACGPTAAILACDLAARGYQAVDVGDILERTYPWRNNRRPSGDTPE